MACSKLNMADYTLKLKKCIYTTFVTFIKPHNILYIFREKDGKNSILTDLDIDSVTAWTNTQGDMQGATLLLDRLCSYNNWFVVLLEVLRHPAVKLGHVAEEMERMKAKMDRNIEEEHERQERAIRQQQEEISRRDQIILELRKEREELNQQIQTQREEKQSQDLINQQQRAEYEHRILEIQKKNQEQAQIIAKKDQEIVSLQPLKYLLTTKENDSIVLFNDCIVKQMMKEYRKVAKKYGIKGVYIPPELEGVAKELLFCNIDSDRRQEIEEEVKKEKSFLKKELLMRKLEIYRKNYRGQPSGRYTCWKLMCDSREFFFYAFYSLMCLESEGESKMPEFLIWCRDIISKDIHGLVVPLGGWQNVYSRYHVWQITTYWKKFFGIE